MSEYNMSHTGAELDDAINKVQSGYLLPIGSVSIAENGTHDVSEFAQAVVNVPVPDGYIDKSTITHFATGTVSNVTAGQALEVSGIVDEATGETFEVKGVMAYIQCTENTWLYPANHASAVPAVFFFVKDTQRGFGGAVACAAQTTTASNVREIRFNADIGGITGSSSGNAYITLGSGYFKYKSSTSSMYGLLAADTWRWVAWA